MNVLVLQDHLAELEADVESGVLSADQLEQGRIELERRLLEETQGTPDENQERDENHAGSESGESLWSRRRPKLALILGLCLPVLTLALYAKIGRMDLLDGVAQVQTDGAPQPVSDNAIQEMVQGLADRLAAQPDDPGGWMMLGRSYTVLPEYQKSADAYKRALEWTGDHPDVLAAYADARLMANGGNFDGESIDLISRALQNDPDHTTSLWLAGTLAFRQADYAKTLEIWQRVAAQAPEGSELARTMAANIAETRALLQSAESRQEE